MKDHLTYFLLVTVMVVLGVFLKSKNDVPAIELKTYATELADTREQREQIRAFDADWHPWSTFRSGFFAVPFSFVLMLLIWPFAQLKHYFKVTLWTWAWIGLLHVWGLALAINSLWDKVEWWHVDTTSWIGNFLPQAPWMYWASGVIFLGIMIIIYFHVFKWKDKNIYG